MLLKLVTVYDFNVPVYSFSEWPISTSSTREKESTQRPRTFQEQGKIDVLTKFAHLDI